MFNKLFTLNRLLTFILIYSSYDQILGFQGSVSQLQKYSQARYVVVI